VHTSYLHNKAKEIIKPANLLECTELNMWEDRDNEGMKTEEWQW
jgi:hypothetical protein